MVEVESMATQGNISRPGAWSFPDALELGTPGGGTLTWEESKSNLALFAVSSSPIFLGNDRKLTQSAVAPVIDGSILSRLWRDCSP